MSGDRYISQNALITEIAKIHGNLSTKNVGQAIWDTPTADVVEVRRGSFVWIADDSPMCNICGKVFDTNDDADAGLWKFCPECGAKMDGERRANDGT